MKNQPSAVKDFVQQDPNDLRISGSPREDTKQLWNTVLVPSSALATSCNLNKLGTELREASLSDYGACLLATLFCCFPSSAQAGTLVLE